MLAFQGTPRAWFADRLHECDLARFSAEIGKSDFNTVWELLALLVACKLWLPRVAKVCMVTLKSDSIAALRAFRKGASAAHSLNLLLRDMAFLEASFS